MADWYYAKNGQQQGPVSPGELKKMVTSGDIGPTDLLFQEGGTQWVEANTVKGLFPAGGVASKPAPAPAPRRTAEPEPEPAPRGRARRDDVGELPTDEDYERRPAKTTGGRGGFGDLMMFRTFIAPWLIVLGFWVMSALILLFGLLAGLGGVYAMTQNALQGLLLVLLALISTPMMILYVRVLCEVMIIFFRQYDAIVDVRKELEKRQG